MAKLSKNQEIAQNFIQKCKEYGFSFKVRDTVVSVSKTIATNNSEAFATAENQSSSLLIDIPMTTPGSVWGTDGGSIGGLSAMQTGAFSMNQSGCSKRVLNAIRKMA